MLSTRLSCAEGLNSSLLSRPTDSSVIFTYRLTFRPMRHTVLGAPILTGFLRYRAV